MISYSNKEKVIGQCKTVITVLRFYFEICTESNVIGYLRYSLVGCEYFFLVGGSRK